MNCKFRRTFRHFIRAIPVRNVSYLCESRTVLRIVQASRAIGPNCEWHVLIVNSNYIQWEIEVRNVTRASSPGSSLLNKNAASFVKLHIEPLSIGLRRGEHSKPEFMSGVPCQRLCVTLHRVRHRQREAAPKKPEFQVANGRSLCSELLGCFVLPFSVQYKLAAEARGIQVKP